MTSLLDSGVSQADLRSLWERAQRGLAEARRRRKYCPPGPYTPVENEALSALVDIEQAARQLLRDAP